VKIARVIVRNFRGIVAGEVLLDGHTVLVGDNNVGKSTLLEAIDLVLGPERSSRRPVVDEHDFFAGNYFNSELGTSSPIQSEVVVVDLSEEQTRHFRDHLEFWDTTQRCFAAPPANEQEPGAIEPALRVFFNGWYDPEEDDFAGATYFAVPISADGQFVPFRTQDKRKCGFLFLRTLRTASRALSLERGTLLDIILRLKETRLQMWEQVLASLRGLNVADNHELGELLAAVQDSVRRYVPADWAEAPHLRVTDLTREALRRSLTVFMGTGANRTDGTPHAAPFQHQGTGTINTLVLALLTIIAELRQNVIFAMEEPEIALPPHTQKRIINAVRERSSQAIFTSHSPYVLEEFEPKQVQVLRRATGVLRSTPAAFPPAVRAKAYRNEFRTRFCEALLAKHVLVLEGRTEFDAMPAAARRLHELRPGVYKTFEALGVALVDAQGETNVAPLSNYFKSLGKQVFAVCDRQDAAARAAIAASVHQLFESPHDGFEDLVLHNTAEAGLRRYASAVVAANEWPQHLAARTPRADTSIADLRTALRDYFGWAKGRGDAGDLLAICELTEIPEYVREVVSAISRTIEPLRLAPLPPPGQAGEAAVAEAMPAAPRVYPRFVPTPPVPVPPEQ